MRNKRLLTVVLFVASSVSMACETQRPTPPDAQPSASPPASARTPFTTFTLAPRPPNDIHTSAHTLQRPSLRDTTSAGPTTTATDDAGVSYDCVTTLHDATVDTDSIFQFDVAIAKTLPGLLVDTASLVNMRIAPVAVARSPITLSVNLAVENTQVVVNSPNSGNIQQGVSVLQRRIADADIPAIFASSEVIVQSFDEMVAKLGMSASYSGFLASGGFKLAIESGRTTKTRTVVVQLMQPMYTISFVSDAIADERSFFSDASGVAFYQAANPKPSFISAVTYGKLLIYVISTDSVSSDDDLVATIQASYAGASASVEAKKKYTSLLENSKKLVHVLGGAQADGDLAVTTGDPYKFFVASSAKVAIPMYYEAQSLEPHRPPTAAQLTKQFSTQVCSPRPPTLSKDLVPVQLHRGTALPKHTVSGGQEAGQETVVCRAYPYGVPIVGKYWPPTQQCIVAFMATAAPFDDFDILTIEDTSAVAWLPQADGRGQNIMWGEQWPDLLQDVGKPHPPAAICRVRADDGWSVGWEWGQNCTYGIGGGGVRQHWNRYELLRKLQ